MMRICPLPDLELEAIFVSMRRFILVNLHRIEGSPKLIYFLSTLCLHCFINEYVYFESDEEYKLICELETMFSESIIESKQPKVLKLLCFASYRSLHKYNWCQELTALDKFEEVKKRLIEEPLSEKDLSKNIAVVGNISDEISRKVKAQYEEAPYPRWIKPVLLKAKSIDEFCSDTNIRLYSENIKDTSAPKILVAGCGTGQHSIETASHFRDSMVTAVDLSFSSLAYAKRKTDEIEITNLEYMQSDILNLSHLEKEFDIIECVGVLHHMSEPIEGWRVLTKILKSGGLMRIGLYSELARQHIVEIQKKIKSLKLSTSSADMRQFRQSIIASPNHSHKQLTKLSDFFSLSMLRDLIFHEQELRFTVPQIASCLDELGLKFCGFGNKDIISKFKAFHGKEANVYDLLLWQKYEENNPKAFLGMYQFWCQKL